jgi:TolB protein
LSSGLVLAILLPHLKEQLLEERNGAGRNGDRLESWGEIAKYLGKSVTTVQRWEQHEGLPIYRLDHNKRGSVFAYSHELDRWRDERSRRPRPVDSAGAEPPGTITAPASTESTVVSAPPEQRAVVPPWFRQPRGVTIALFTFALLGYAAFALARGTWMPLVVPPETPGYLRVESPLPGKVVLRWRDPSMSERRFEVAVSGKIVATAPEDATSVELTRLDAGTSYHWDVRACNRGGCSPWHGIIGKTPDGSDADVTLPGSSTTGAADPFDLVFASNRKTTTERLQIWVTNRIGSSPIRLTYSNANDSSPSWSPDRRQIAFSSDVTGFSDIFVMNADGSNRTNLTRTDPAQDVDPAWSPDGTRIVFTSTRTGNGEVWMIDNDGSNPRNLTNSPRDDGQAAWSPDGRRIAFVSNRAGRPEANDIYVMNADGLDQRRLTFDGAVNRQPAWSPDGRRIAFQTVRDGNEEIYLMNADGSNAINLTRHPAADASPAWSPDGQRIAFETNRDGNVEIYTMAGDGSDLFNLTSIHGTDLRPDWGLPLRLDREPRAAARSIGARALPDTPRLERPAR